MDDNTLMLVEKLIETQKKLSELQAMQRQLVTLLWNAELAEAVDGKKYSWKYGENLNDTKVKTCDVREIFGIMPNPEAVAIYKNAKEEADNDED